MEGNSTKCTVCGAQRDTSFTEQPSVHGVLGRYRETQKRNYCSSHVGTKNVGEADVVVSKTETEESEDKGQESEKDTRSEQMDDTHDDSSNDKLNSNDNKIEEEEDDDGDLIIIEEVTSSETSARRCSSAEQRIASLQ